MGAVRDESGLHKQYHHRHHRIPNLKVFAGLQVRHRSSGLSGTRLSLCCSRRMAERITGRPWSAYEDLLLSKAVAEFDGEADWKTIAQRVPGRTNKACRKVCFAIITCRFLWRIPLRHPSS